MPKIENLVAAVFDTHVWVWSAAGDERASAIKNFSGTAYLSAISLWEVSMLEMKGRLRLEPNAEEWLMMNIESPISVAALTAEISLRSCQLESFHGDPADRIIIATAITLGIPLITADAKIIRWNEDVELLQVIGI